MSDPRKRKSSRKGAQQKNTYSSVLGDPLHLVDSRTSDAKENRPKYRYVLAGGRRSSDRDRAELAYRWANLSPREQDVTVLVCKGYTNEQIARSLNITVSSVKTYLRFVFLELDVDNRIDLRLKFYNFHFQPKLP
jgi:DNA-binding NarL/FixJ family response regulator